MSIVTDHVERLYAPGSLATAGGEVQVGIAADAGLAPAPGARAEAFREAPREPVDAAPPPAAPPRVPAALREA
ncbi:MAG TPA: hypothetical protein VFR81_04310 [Longimicrobium sp.]|nr:hypothetical protein [Longimicrobium sp.]